MAMTGKERAVFAGHGDASCLANKRGRARKAKRHSYHRMRQSYGRLCGIYDTELRLCAREGL